MLAMPTASNIPPGFIGKFLFLFYFLAVCVGGVRVKIVHGSTHFFWRP